MRGKCEYNLDLIVYIISISLCIIALDSGKRKTNQIMLSYLSLNQ